MDSRRDCGIHGTGFPLGLIGSDWPNGALLETADGSDLDGPVDMDGRKNTNVMG